MNRDFLAQCSAIAPLLGDSDSGDLASGDLASGDLGDIEIPGIAGHVACTIANDVATSSDLDALCRDKPMRYCLDTLMMGDFLGHEAMIRASAREIAARLEPMSPMDMRCAIGLDPFPDTLDTVASNEARNDRIWITTSREVWRRSSTQES